MNNNNVNLIVNTIKANPKRMAKLNAIKPFYGKVDKAKAYIMAECRENKMKLSEQEMFDMAMEIVR